MPRGEVQAIRLEPHKGIAIVRSGSIVIPGQPIAFWNEKEKLLKCQELVTKLLKDGQLGASDDPVDVDVLPSRR